MFRLLAAVLTCVVAACGPVPKPFYSAPGQKADNPLLDRSDAESLVVAPLEGVAPELSGPLAERLAERLRVLEIPASTAPVISRAHLLDGEALWRNGVLVTVWHLTDAEGASLGQVSDVRSVARTAFLNGDEELLIALVDHAAPAIANVLANRNSEGTLEDAMRPSAPVEDVPRITVIGVSGAPGDGDIALPTALGTVVRQAGLPFTNRKEEAALKLSGTVQPTNDDGGIVIAWEMFDHQDTLIGKLDQPVPVPPADLAERWGVHAFDASIALLEPLAQVLDALVQAQSTEEEDANTLSRRKKLSIPIN